MADLSGYTPIYVRTTGNDTTGNGSSGSPYATVARAFRHAYFGTANSIVGTEPTQQVMVIDIADPQALGGSADLVINYYDASNSSFATHNINSGSDNSSDAAGIVAINMPTSSSMSATVSGNRVTIYSGQTGPCPDNTYGGDWFAVSGTLLESQVSNTSPAAYIPVSPSSASYVIDVGSGNFGGVNLRNIYTYGASIYTYDDNWPSRIAIRGAGATSSNFGNIDGAGVNGYYDFELSLEIEATAGKTVTITSNMSISLGSITTNGGSDDGATYPGFNGGNISLTDCVCSGGIAANGGNGGSSSAGTGGNIVLTNCTISGSVSTNGGSAINSTAMEAGRSAGTITITDSTIGGNITANGGDGYGSGASVTLTRSSCGTISANGGAATNSNGTNDKNGANGGNISITDGTFGNISTTAGAGGYGFCSGSLGSVTLSGSSTLPNTITAGFIDMTNLRKGRGVNGSSILGIV